MEESTGRVPQSDRGHRRLISGPSGPPSDEIRDIDQLCNIVHMQPVADSRLGLYQLGL
jgi:hypothetical protein